MLSLKFHVPQANGLFENKRGKKQTNKLQTNKQKKNTHHTHISTLSH